MSKIFEALRKRDGGIADLIRPLVEVPPTAAKRTGASNAPERELTPTQAERRTPAQPERGTAAWDEFCLAGVRTLSLRTCTLSSLLPFEDGNAIASEQYRILRTKITQDHRGPRVIVITSPDSADGKSTTAINTAAALSLKSGGLALLVDADLRKPALHVQLGLPEAPGLSEVLQRRATLAQALVHTQELPNLYALTAGTTPRNPVELLDSTQWLGLCGRIRDVFRFVVVDSPPLATVADYDLIQTACDGVILVVRPDHTSRPLLRKALDTIPKEKFLGVVLNYLPKWPLSKYSGVDGYYHYRGTATYRSPS